MTCEHLTHALIAGLSIATAMLLVAVTETAIDARKAMRKARGK